MWISCGQNEQNFGSLGTTPFESVEILLGPETPYVENLHPALEKKLSHPLFFEFSIHSLTESSKFFGSIAGYWSAVVRSRIRQHVRSSLADGYKNCVSNEYQRRTSRTVEDRGDARASRMCCQGSEFLRFEAGSHR